jgi:hypothetical protein
MKKKACVKKAFHPLCDINAYVNFNLNTIIYALNAGSEGIGSKIFRQTRITTVM